jgi:hypothetical protein
MKRVITFVITAWAAVGCGADRRSLSEPSSPGSPSPPAEGIVAVYSATLTASAACAPALAPEVRERTYTATLRARGSLEWSSPL